MSVPCKIAAHERKRGSLLKAIRAGDMRAQKALLRAPDLLAWMHGYTKEHPMARASP